MSYCKKEGLCVIPMINCLDRPLCMGQPRGHARGQSKDKIIFISEEDHAKTSNVVLPDDEEQPGILLPDGKINWNCPCLGGMATGPCGVEFRDAFSCFQYSTATPKGSDCFGQFNTMQECMTQYPNLYPQPDPIPDDIQDELDKELEAELDNRERSTSTVSYDSLATANKNDEPLQRGSDMQSTAAK